MVRRTKVNPSKTRRYPENRRQNQGRLDLLGPACREPDDWAGGDRRIGGVTPSQASAWNCRNQSLRCKGRSTSGDNRKARVPRRSTGADSSVVAVRWGNAHGAKGGGHPCQDQQANGKPEEPLVLAEGGSLQGVTRAV
jgi:hypothetical protein